MRAIQLVEIEAAAHHRNGISGEPFYVGIFGAKVDGEVQPFLGVVFPDMDENGDDVYEGNSRVAIFNLDGLKRHDIAFASNSWRGDNFADVMADVMRAADAALDRKVDFAKQAWS